MSSLQHLLNDTMESPALPPTLDPSVSRSPSPPMEQLPPAPQPPTNRSFPSPPLPPAPAPPTDALINNPQHPDHQHHLPAVRKQSPDSSDSMGSQGSGRSRSNKRRRTNKSNSGGNKEDAPPANNSGNTATDTTMVGNAPTPPAAAEPANGNTEGVVGKSMRRVAEAQEIGNPREVPSELVTPTGHARLSDIDRSSMLKFPRPAEDDPLALPRIVGHKGFRSVRGTHSLTMGSWYFEVELLEMPLKPVPAAVRVGWSTRKLDFETPVGYSAYSFALRDRTCEFINGARRRQYAPEFGPLEVGDVIGCHIVLPQTLTQNQKEKMSMAQILLLEFIYTKLGLGNPPSDAGFSFDKSYCQWFKNGTCLGIPEFFNRRNHEKDELTEGAPDMPKNRGPGFHAGYYYPTISLFNDAMVAVNFGPKFKHPVPEGAKGYCEIEPNDVEESENTTQAPAAAPDQPQTSVSVDVSNAQSTTPVAMENGDKESN